MKRFPFRNRLQSYKLFPQYIVDVVRKLYSFFVFLSILPPKLQKKWAGTKVLSFFIRTFATGKSNKTT